MSEQKDQLEPEMVELSDDEVGEISGGAFASQTTVGGVVG